MLIVKCTDFMNGKGEIVHTVEWTIKLKCQSERFPLSNWCWQFRSLRMISLDCTLHTKSSISLSSLHNLPITKWVDTGQTTPTKRAKLISNYLWTLLSPAEWAQLCQNARLMYICTGGVSLHDCVGVDHFPPSCSHILLFWHWIMLYLQGQELVLPVSRGNNAMYTTRTNPATRLNFLSRLI